MASKSPGSSTRGRKPPAAPLEPTPTPTPILSGGVRPASRAADWDQPPVTAPNALQELPLSNLQPTLCIMSSSVYAGVEVLVDRTLRIGRDADNDIRLPGDIAMSRHHAVISPSQECLFVEDVGSTNGTFVNGARVRRAPLNHNDRVRIGGTLLQVRYEPARPATTVTPLPAPGSLTPTPAPLLSQPASGSGLVLRVWRKEQGLTQTQLATKLGVSQRTVSLWEQGAPISSENLKNLREKAGCDRL